MSRLDASELLGRLVVGPAVVAVLDEGGDRHMACYYDHRSRMFEIYVRTMPEPHPPEWAYRQSAWEDGLRNIIADKQRTARHYQRNIRVEYMPVADFKREICAKPAAEALQLRRRHPNGSLWEPPELREADERMGWIPSMLARLRTNPEHALVIDVGGTPYRGFWSMPTGKTYCIDLALWTGEGDLRPVSTQMSRGVHRFATAMQMIMRDARKRSMNVRVRWVPRAELGAITQLAMDPLDPREFEKMIYDQGECAVVRDGTKWTGYRLSLVEETGDEPSVEVLRTRPQGGMEPHRRITRRSLRMLAAGMLERRAEVIYVSWGEPTQYNLMEADGPRFGPPQRVDDKLMKALRNLAPGRVVTFLEDGVPVAFLVSDSTPRGFVAGGDARFWRQRERVESKRGEWRWQDEWDMPLHTEADLKAWLNRLVSRVRRRGKNLRWIVGEHRPTEVEFVGRERADVEGLAIAASSIPDGQMLVVSVGGKPMAAYFKWPAMDRVSRFMPSGGKWRLQPMEDLRWRYRTWGRPADVVGRDSQHWLPELMRSPEAQLEWSLAPADPDMRRQIVAARTKRRAGGIAVMETRERFTGIQGVVNRLWDTKTVAIAMVGSDPRVAYFLLPSGGYVRLYPALSNPGRWWVSNILNVRIEELLNTRDIARRQGQNLRIEYVPLAEFMNGVEESSKAELRARGHLREGREERFTDVRAVADRLSDGRTVAIAKVGGVPNRAYRLRSDGRYARFKPSSEDPGKWSITFTLRKTLDTGARIEELFDLRDLAKSQAGNLRIEYVPVEEFEPHVRDHSRAYLREAVGTDLERFDHERVVRRLKQPGTVAIFHVGDRPLEAWMFSHSRFGEPRYDIYVRSQSGDGWNKTFGTGTVGTMTRIRDEARESFSNVRVSYTTLDALRKSRPDLRESDGIRWRRMDLPDANAALTDMPVGRMLAVEIGGRMERGLIKSGRGSFFVMRTMPEGSGNWAVIVDTGRISAFHYLQDWLGLARSRRENIRWAIIDPPEGARDEVRGELQWKSEDDRKNVLSYFGIRESMGRMSNDELIDALRGMKRSDMFTVSRGDGKSWTFTRVRFLGNGEGWLRITRAPDGRAANAIMAANIFDHIDEFRDAARAEGQNLRWKLEPMAPDVRAVVDAYYAARREREASRDPDHG
jgi:hypothetical protein